MPEVYTLHCRHVNVDAMATEMVRFGALPYGQYMHNAGQLVIEVHFVPLPVQELEERRSRLRGLLLRGALRSVRQEADSAQFTDAQTLATVPK